MHSSISSANEYVSEDIVARKSLCSMSSGAIYLTFATGDIVKLSVSRDPWKTFAIPKSQICGSPYPAYRQLLFIGGETVFHLFSDKHIILCTFSR